MSLLIHGRSRSLASSRSSGLVHGVASLSLSAPTPWPKQGLGPSGTHSELSALQCPVHLATLGSPRFRRAPRPVGTWRLYNGGR